MVAWWQQTRYHHVDGSTCNTDDCERGSRGRSWIAIHVILCMAYFDYLLRNFQSFFNHFWVKSLPEKGAIAVGKIMKSCWWWWWPVPPLPQPPLPPLPLVLWAVVWAVIWVGVVGKKIVNRFKFNLWCFLLNSWPHTKFHFIWTKDKKIKKICYWLALAGQSKNILSHCKLLCFFCCWLALVGQMGWSKNRRSQLKHIFGCYPITNFTQINENTEVHVFGILRK